MPRNFHQVQRPLARVVEVLVAASAAGLTACATSGPAAEAPPAPAAPAAAPVATGAPSPPRAEAHEAGAVGTPSPDPPAVSEARAPALGPVPPPVERLPLPPGTKVLHVGDSFAGALGVPLGELLEQAGVHSILKHKDSSYLTTWAWEPELEREIWRYNPDLVVITLGANELAIADPQQREKTVRKIVSKVGKRPCLWVAIPLWSERHNGLLDVIEKSSGPCVFYDTNAELDTLAMPRIHDGIHPTNAARRAWAEAVFEYMVTHRQPQQGAPWWLAPPTAPP